MLWLKRNKEDAKFFQLHSLLANSFANVKRDTIKLFQWTNFLYQKSLEQERLVRQLQLELSCTPKNPEDIRRVVDSYYSYENLTEKIRMLNEKIDILKEQKAPAKPVVYDVEQRLERLEQHKKASMREKIVKRLTRNSREYIKSLVLSY